MSNLASATIPFEDIKKVEVYVNSGKKSLDTIKTETKADYIINGVLYNMNTFVPVVYLKADGEYLCKPSYSVYGYHWDEGDDFGMALLPTNKKNCFAGCALIRYGKKVENLSYDAGVGGTRGRTAIGTKGGKLALYCTRDGTSSARTPERLRDDLFAAGWDSAVMLDGGGSSQCNLNGERVTSTRKVQNLILVYLRGKETKESGDGLKVCLDAGHDAKNYNASPDKTYYEHEFALDMSKRIAAILEAHGVEVTQTRKGGEEVSLTDRCNIANAVSGLDLFVSLHSNAAADSGWSSASGWEAYCYSLNGDGHAAAKAIMNRAKEVAKPRTTPIIANPKLSVLKGTKAPAVLIEHGFHTNKTDVANLKSAEYRDKLAKAEAYGILDYLGVKVQEAKPAPPPATPAGGIDITKLTDDQILYLAKRIREVEAKQTNSAASELRAAFDSMI